MTSLVDQVYRSFVISKFFSRGWGNPNDIKRLFDFRKYMASRELCMKLVDPNHPIIIDKVQLDDSKECKLIDGHFRSPFADHLPGLLPTVAENAYFQLVVPANGWSGPDRPLCIQMAGTGDHHFWRRRNFLARPLVKGHGISSLILENPFYGLRKPKDQFRSSLLNVSDLFVMGGSLILEGIAILHWCEKEGFGPMIMHGISLGGHMASLTAVTWHKPIGLVPCLSPGVTASGVFTEGVMSGAINWKSLETQFFSNTFFKDELYKMVWSNNDEAYLAGKDFVNQFKAKLNSSPVSSADVDEKASNLLLGGKAKVVEKSMPPEKNNNNLFQALTNFLRERGLLKILPDLNTLTSKESSTATETASPSPPISSGKERESKMMDFRNTVLGNKKAKVQKEAIQFMRGVMDEFTHLQNFSKPVDPSMIIVIAARDDAYVPCEGYQPLDHIWPGCEVRFVDGGHISSYVLHQGLFRKTIAEAVDRFREKYHADGTLKEVELGSPSPLIQQQPPSEETDKKVIQVLGFQNTKAAAVNDANQRV